MAPPMRTKRKKRQTQCQRGHNALFLYPEGRTDIPQRQAFVVSCAPAEGVFAPVGSKIGKDGVIIGYIPFARSDYQQG